jgi:hypothetical protein
MPLNSNEIETVEANLFPHARQLVRKAPVFPWHRDQAGLVTAGRRESSQALALDLFVTIDSLGSRDAILNAWMTALSLQSGAHWSIEPEVCLPRALLGEPRPSQIDVRAQSGASIVLFECKFTEPDGGGCSQPRTITSGRHAGMAQCSGAYVEQVNPVNGVSARCALSGKGIRYWEFVPEVLAFDPTSDYRPCPFASGWYQWMRNLVAARALSKESGLPAAFVVVYADGPFPMAGKVKSEEWQRLVETATGRAVPLRVASYQQLLAWAVTAAAPDERPILRDLTAWIERKFADLAATQVL